ncbi:hypothetical protein AB9R12_08325 [Neisseria gonorrhoeae]
MNIHAAPYVHNKKNGPVAIFRQKLKNRRDYNRFCGEMKVLIYFVFLGRKKAGVREVCNGKS